MENRYSPDNEVPDTLQHVYDVYKAVYSPWDWARISDDEPGPGIYEGITYYVIQRKIYYDYYFRTYGPGHKTIDPFRPVIANNTISLLYLNNDYRYAIYCFLGSEYLHEETHTIISPEVPVKDTYERYKFLNHFLVFTPYHWGNCWYLETHPTVDLISFNLTKDSAQVYYNTGCAGAEVILGKENNEWRIVDHYSTWISK